MSHIKIILSLLVVVLLSMVGVFVVEGITTPIINERLAREANAALFEIFPEADDLDPVTEDYPSDDVVKDVWIMKSGGKQVGVVYKAQIAGYNPGIEFLLGVNTDTDEVAGYKTLKNGETAGLGKDLLENPLFAEQFAGQPVEDLKDLGVDLVAGSTAKLTLGGVNTGVKSVLTYHAVNFKGEIVLTPEEQFKADYFPGATFTDVTGDYAMNELVLEVHEASTGGYLIKAIFNGYALDSLYMVGVKDTTVLGFGVISTNESTGIGKDLVESPAFAEQFVGKSVDSIRNTGVDAVSGTSAPITLGGVNDSLKEVLGYYNSEIAGIRDTEPPVITINEERSTVLEFGAKAPNWNTYVSVTDNEDEDVFVINDADTVVDMNTEGTYVVTFTAIDSSSNISEVQITFTVSKDAGFVLVPAPSNLLPVLEGMSAAEQFHDEGIEQDLIKGVYTGRDNDGNVVSIFYYVTSNNGSYSPDNHILVQFSVNNDSIIAVNVFEDNSTYTDEYSTGKGNKLGHPDVVGVWDGKTNTGQVTTGDLDSVSGTTADYSFPSFIESVEQAIEYQKLNNVGGA